jgi:hypothetical protein
VTPEGQAWGLDSGSLGGLAALERDVHASSGRALLRIGDADAIVARPVGKGWAVYLNVLLDRYPTARGKGDGGQAYRALLTRLLEHVGVRPSVHVLDAAGHPLDRTRIAHYRFGDSEIVALLRDPAEIEAIRGRDGVTVYEDQALGKVAREDIGVRLPRVSYVTDARTGRFLGQTDRVSVSVVTGEAAVLALSPARSTMAIDGPTESARGERISFRLTSTSGGKRLVRCHVFGPDGAFLHVYATNVVSDGPASFVLPAAVNDPPGAYRIRATDVLSGAEAETTLTLR